ncbi:MAG: TonB-dependent receptor [Bacteroides sp.]|nr:TonB-dependent receptor [Bacteroides sp.]
MIKYKSILFVIAWVFATVAIAQEKAEEQLRITGRVLDASTLIPLPGMNISLPDVSAAMTDDNGEFSIRVPSYDVELRISGPGYQSKLVAGKGRERVEIFLHEAGFQSVYKEVLTPFGEVNNSHITTSMSVYDRDNLLSTVISGEELLQGNIAGLNVLLRSGIDGAGANMFMRGFNSIYANTQPLLVLDGMVIENQSSGVSLVDGFLSTPLGVIDVKNIERITVMKDGTSLYGVKGGNGVILIETLRSKEVATKIDIRAMAGLNMTPSKIPLLNASEQKKYLVDLYQSAGYTAEQIQALPFINQQKPVQQRWGYDGNVDYYRYNHNTDWQDQLFTESFKQNYSLGVTGGDDVAVYALTLGYQINEGVIRGNDYSRFNAQINTDINLSERLKLHSNMYFIYGKRNLTDQGGGQHTNPIYASLIKAPFMSPNVYNEEGLSSPNLERVDLFGFSNPAVITRNAMQENSNYGFLGSMELAYNVWCNLTVSSAVGLRFYKERERVFLPGGIAHDILPTALVDNAMQHHVERTLSISNETRANYLFKFAHDHSLNTIVGFRYQHNKVEDDWGKSYNSPSDDFTSLGNGLNSLALVNGSLGTWN